MKLLLLLAMVFLVACGSPDDNDKTESVIVTGQSNSLRCDWGYFTEQTGYEVVHLGRPGTDIDLHIAKYDFDLRGVDAVAMILIHGGADAKIGTHPPYWIERMNHYRSMVHEDLGRKLPFIVSNIGYNTEYPDANFDAMREEVNKQKSWIIAFNGAQYFREIGMLADKTHYTPEGCRLVLDAIINLGMPVALARGYKNH